MEKETYNSQNLKEEYYHTTGWHFEEDHFKYYQWAENRLIKKMAEEFDEYYFKQDSCTCTNCNH